MQKYSFDSKENISYWIHFSGYEVENLLTQLNLTAGKHHLNESIIFPHCLTVSKKNILHTR